MVGWVTAIAAVAVVLSPSRAFASCGVALRFPEAIREAPAVFVGEVSAVANDRRWAEVEVTELWSGDPIPPRVEVRAGPKDPPGKIGTMTTVDRYYRAGQTYLFVPYDRTSDTVFRDNACTRTAVYRDALERYRPSSAVSVGVSPTPTASPSHLVAHDEPHGAGGISSFQWFMSLVFAAGLVAVLLLAWRNRGPKGD